MLAAVNLFLPTNASEFWTAFAALSAVGAILVALFLPEIRRRWDRPVLSIEAKLEPPGCHLLEMRGEMIYFLRLWVGNNGRQPAENVQVFAAELAHWVGGAFVPDKFFLPMNLRWTHAAFEASTFLDRINPGMGAHCELGSMRQAMGSMNQPEPDYSYSLELALEAPLYWLEAGKHRLTLKVAGSNAKPVTAMIEVELDGKYDLDQSVMFTKHLGLKVIT